MGILSTKTLGPLGQGILGSQAFNYSGASISLPAGTAAHLEDGTTVWHQEDGTTPVTTEED